MACLHGGNVQRNAAVRKAERQADFFRMFNRVLTLPFCAGALQIHKIVRMERVTVFVWCSVGVQPEDMSYWMNRSDCRRAMSHPFLVLQR